VIDDVLDEHTAASSPDEWDFDALWAELKTLYPIGITIEEVVAEAGEKGRVNRDFVRREILSDAKLAYERREQQLGSPAMRELERRVVLSVIDRRWRDHLYEMDYLKDGIGLRAMAQRDPLVEYQREGYAMFQQMMGQIREETVGFLFNLEVEVAPQAGVGGATIEAKGLGRQGASDDKLSYSAPSDSGGVEVRNQRGQVQQAATQRARRAVAQAQAPEAEAARGAFGQRTQGGGEVAPQNRAERRAQERKGR
jgi:preprotein translocase subunit SecA